MKSAVGKVGLVVTAVLVAVLTGILTGTLTGGGLTANGEDSPAAVAELRVVDDQASPESNPAAREFVTAKQKWTACVGEAAPAHDVEDGRFDPEQACGPKPHPHDFADKHAGKVGQGKHGSHGPPAWAGGPERRSAEPPGHAERD